MGNNHQLSAKSAVVDFSLTVATTSGTTSTEIDLQGRTLVGLITPAGLSSTAITFKSAITQGGTAILLADKDDADFTVTCAASTQYHLEPTVFAGVRFLTLELGTSETATITLVTRPIL